MDKYLQQLTEDLYNKTLLLQESSDFNTEIEVATPSTATTQKSIAELSGIGREVFPDSELLTLSQCSQLNECILNIFACLNIAITDLPKNLPSELLYKILLSTWDSKYNYSPVEGVDVTFCTGDVDTCPYGIYCLSVKEDDRMEIPDRYNIVIPEISRVLNAGNVCFLNPESQEIEEVPGKMLENPEAFYAENGSLNRGTPFQHLLWENYYLFEPLQEEDLWGLLEMFAEKIPDLNLRNKLNKELNSLKPFSYLERIIHNSEQNHNWQLFRLAKIESYVIAHLWYNLNNWPNLFRNEIGGEKRDSLSIQDKTPDV